MSMKIRLFNKNPNAPAFVKSAQAPLQKHKLWVISGLVLALTGCFDSDDDNDYQAPQENDFYEQVCAQGSNSRP